MFRPLMFAAVLALPISAWAQAPDSAPLISSTGNITALRPAAAAADPVAPSAPEGLTPTWETQRNSRTYLLSIPAPRGQIVDRNGVPFAQTRVSYNLGIAFPTPLQFTDRQVITFAQQQVASAQAILGRQIPFTPELALKHYKNRGVLPLVIAQDLKPMEVDAIRQKKSDTLVLQPTYQRFYPGGAFAGHVIGYAGRTGRMPDGVLQNNDTLWPGAEGREGIEQSFNEQLQGKAGTLNISFDPSGKKTSEQVMVPPQPGYNVVTTIDERIQRLCEESLAKGTKRGAIVVMDPNNGDILALASWPTINPNSFVPIITAADYKALQEDPNIPLLPRAFRSAYPPGSTFKVFVGLAALNSGKIEAGDEFNCPSAMSIGNLVFRNWKKTDAGSLNFADALTQSCNTWFYQCGMKIGGRVITDYCSWIGLGAKTGIPLAAEAEGRVMNDDYMMRVYKRHMLNGDLANLSIGQGDTLITPLQMAQAMGAIGNGGSFYQTRLVSQVQSVDGQIVAGYDVRARGVVDITEKTMKTMRRAMISVVSSRMGTAGRASVKNVEVAGKTGTAQWGPKNKERTAAWFAGFAPAEEPRYAFAAVYEGDAGNDDVHGGTEAAPLIGRVLKEVFKDEPKPTKKKKKDESEEASEDGEESDDAPRRSVERAPAPAPPPPPPKPAPQKRGWFNWFRR